MAENKNEMREIRKSIKDLIEWQKKFTKSIAELKESQKKTDEQQKKTDEQIRKTDQNVGRLTNGWGKFVEGLVAPSIPKLFGEMGIDINTIYQRAKKRKDGDTLEIDILAIGKRVDGQEVIIAVEVKSDLGVREVKDCIEDLRSFFDFFDEYRGKDLIGVVSGIRLTSGAEKHAEREGLYILGPSDETMLIVNKKGFKPKIWKG